VELWTTGGGVDLFYSDRVCHRSTVTHKHLEIDP
jgi:hypothetical protein